MRLFIAIQLNEEMRNLLSDIQDSYRSMAVRGNYTPAENLHLTLAFIGEYDDPGKVLDALENVSFQPFRISLSRIGCFGDLHWAGIADSPQIENLVKQIRHALSDAGIPFDKKRFRAHITFLRKATFPRGGKTSLPSIEPANMLLPSIEQANMPHLSIKPANMLVDEISLMCSTRGKHGMIYTRMGAVAARDI